MVQSVLGYLLLAVALSPAIVGLGWAVWQGHVRPALISKREIERMADEVLAEGHDEPLDVVEGYEYHVWRQSDGFEQGRWRRVRRAVQQKLER